MTTGSSTAAKTEGADSKPAANQKRSVRPASKKPAPTGASPPLKIPPASSQPSRAIPNPSNQQSATKKGRGNGATLPATGAQKSVPNATKKPPSPSPTSSRKPSISPYKAPPQAGSNPKIPASPRQNPKSRALKPQKPPPQSTPQQSVGKGAAAIKPAPAQGKASAKPAPAPASASPPSPQPNPSRSRSPRQTNPLAISATQTKPVEPTKVATAETSPGAQASTAPRPTKSKRPISPRTAAQSPSIRERTAPVRPGAQAGTGSHASTTKGLRSAGAPGRRARGQTPTTISDEEQPGARASSGNHASTAKGLRSGAASGKRARAKTPPPNNNESDCNGNPGAQAATGGHASTTKGLRSADGVSRRTRAQAPPPIKEQDGKPGAQAATGNHASTSKGHRSSGMRRTPTTADGRVGAKGNGGEIHRTRSTGSPTRSRSAEPGVVAQRERRADHNPERTESLTISAKVGARPSNRSTDPSRRKQARKKRGAPPATREPEITIPPVSPRSASVAVAARSARGEGPTEEAVAGSFDNSNEVKEETEMDKSHNTTSKNKRDESETDRSRRDENLVEAFVVEDTQQNQAPVQVIVQAAVEVDNDNNNNKQSEEAEKRRFYMFVVLVVCCGLVLVVVAIVVAVVIVVAQSNSGDSSETTAQGPLITIAPRPVETLIDGDTPVYDEDDDDDEAEQMESENLQDLPNFEERDVFYDWFYDVAFETIVRGSDAAEVYLDSENSSYRKALHWLVFKDQMQLTPGDGERRARQRYVMALFYFETTIEGGWRACNPPDDLIATALGDDADVCEHETLQKDGLDVDSLHYSVTPGIRWLSKNEECSWAGVACSRDGLESVTRIRLGGYELSGSIPPELEHLSTLKILELPYNDLEGDALDVLGVITGLKTLNLSQNRLEGDIPRPFCDLRDLDTIELGGNQLYGTIPRCWGDEVVNLRFIDLSDNRLSGTVPPELGRLEELEELLLQNNDLTGEMNRDVCAQTRFEVLNVIGMDCLGPFGEAEVQCPCCTICCNRDGECEEVEPETRPTGAGRPQRRSFGPFL